ncbi:MAG: PEP-CTERM sorting domain-containing protein [Caldilineaceae bacterium]|nr:PEP-CTERM sorting domain-containing protein [Caldilineaceae bacterium]
MNRTSSTQLVVLAVIVFLLAVIALPGWEVSNSALAQDAPAVTETDATEPPTFTPTNTAAPTDTPVPTNTPTNTPVTPVATDTFTPVPSDTPTTIVTQAPTPEPSFTPTPPPSGPVPIPEPITVVLFGTGLAALSAAVASRRKNKE